jgi:hypothetical protein
MPRSSERYSDGPASSLAIHLCLYCAVAACFALVMYYLMQPTRLPNPDVAAVKPRPTTNYMELLRSEREAAKAEMRIEREFETTSAATREESDIKPETKKAEVKPETKKAVKPETKKAKVQTSTQSRSRPVPRPQRAPETPPHYAQPPSFGDYRPMY